MVTIAICGVGMPFSDPTNSTKALKDEQLTAGRTEKFFVVTNLTNLTVAVIRPSSNVRTGRLKA